MVVCYCKNNYEWQKEQMVCTKTLYNYIDKGFLRVRNIDLCLKVGFETKEEGNKRNKKIMVESLRKRQVLSDKFRKISLNFFHLSI